MFIERIYKGDFDSVLFLASGPLVDRKKIGPILSTYRKILKEYAPELLQEREGLPSGLIDQMRASGFFGLTVEPEYGGLGLNLHEYLVVIQEMVKLDISIAITFLAHLSIGVKAVSLFGNEDQKRKYLPQAASGQMVFAYALTEPRIGSDAQHIETVATPADGTHHVLNGQKAYITNANYAGGLTVFAQLDPHRPGFLGAFIVETGWEGVKVGMEMPKMGLKASSTATIQFRNVRVPVENMIGKPGDGFKIAMSVLNYGRLGLGAASAAVLEASARDMLKRSSSRIQFQVPIKSFQLVQEKIVRAEVNSAVSSAMNAFIAGALQKEPLLPMAIETSHCKLFGTTRAWEAVYDGLQVAGGSGYLKTLPYEKRMRDFRVATVFEGTTEIHSIYPALFGMRQLGRLLKSSGSPPLGLAVELVKSIAGRMKWPVRFENATMKNALGEAKKNSRLVRILLLAGLLFYGRKIQRGEIGKREFLFRRITTLSTYSFGLLSLLAELHKKRKSGALSKKDLEILDYFVAEAKEVRRQNRHFFDSRKERLSSTLFSRLDNE
ncbi:MAG: acyl-CoA dehydrogenase family protein [Syntrophobacteraceae bacterium]